VVCQYNILPLYWYTIKCITDKLILIILTVKYRIHIVIVHSIFNHEIYLWQVYRKITRVGINSNLIKSTEISRSVELSLLFYCDLTSCLYPCLFHQITIDLYSSLIFLHTCLLTFYSQLAIHYFKHSYLATLGIPCKLLFLCAIIISHTCQFVTYIRHDFMMSS